MSKEIQVLREGQINGNFLIKDEIFVCDGSDGYAVMSWDGNEAWQIGGIYCTEKGAISAANETKEIK